MKWHAIQGFNIGPRFFRQNTSGDALGVSTPKASPSGWVFRQGQYPMIKIYNKLPIDIFWLGVGLKPVPSHDVNMFIVHTQSARKPTEVPGLRQSPKSEWKSLYDKTIWELIVWRELERIWHILLWYWAYCQANKRILNKSMLITRHPGTWQTAKTIIYKIEIWVTKVHTPWIRTPHPFCT